MTFTRAHDGDVYAALDLGTNNCRLLLAYPAFRRIRGVRSLKAVDSFSRIVRLGEGVSQTGNLSPDAIERTMAALRICARKLEGYSVGKARFVATEACRRASNANEFVQRVQNELGFTIEIIPTEEEARLAILGCCSLLKPRMKKAVALDIGGGSTEVMWVDIPASFHSQNPPQFPFDPIIRGWTSIPYGVMSLAESVGNAHYAEMYYEETVEKIVRLLQPVAAQHPLGEEMKNGEVQFLSTSGTVTTLAAIHLNLARYDRAQVDGISLSINDVLQSIRRLLGMRASERFMHPCIGPDRSDYIISGCAIFEAVTRVFPFHEVTIADRGVREGIILSLMLGDT